MTKAQLHPLQKYLKSWNQ